MYTDAYAHLYQKLNGFKIKIFAPNKKELDGYLSLKPSTRSTYDIAMRDATIDGLLTSDNITDIKPSMIFYRENNPSQLFLLQSVNEFEFQKNSRNINAIKQNSFITVQRKKYDEIKKQETYQDVYINIISFITMMNKDEKNFAPGVEDTTIINLQIPKRDIEENIYELKNEDRIIVKNLKNDLSAKIKIESIDAFAVPGITKIYGTFDTRTGE